MAASREAHLCSHVYGQAVVSHRDALELGDVGLQLVVGSVVVVDMSKDQPFHSHLVFQGDSLLDAQVRLGFKGFKERGVDDEGVSPINQASGVIAKSAA